MTMFNEESRKNKKRMKVVRNGIKEMRRMNKQIDLIEKRMDAIDNKFLELGIISIQCDKCKKDSFKLIDENENEELSCVLCFSK